MPNVLIVDDEELICEDYELFLSSEGYAVKSANSAETALILMETETPDLILLDINMPGMSGLELLQRIKENDSGISVIMITGVLDIETAISP